jgi:hypothetical protein
MLSGCLVPLGEQTEEISGECSERLCTSRRALSRLYRSAVLCDAYGLAVR